MRFAGGAVLGGILGAFLGFLLRPSLPLLGQLPLGVVITRGEFLHGFDALFKPMAEQSFNYYVGRCNPWCGFARCGLIVAEARSRVVLWF